MNQDDSFDSIFILCEDVLHVIMSHIEAEDRTRLATVSRRMGRIVGLFPRRVDWSDEYFFVVRDIARTQWLNALFDHKDEISLRFESFSLCDNGRGVDRLMGICDTLSVLVDFKATKDQRLFFITYPSAITTLKFRKTSLAVQVDLSRIPDETFQLSDVFDDIVYCKHWQFGPSNEFFTDANYYHDKVTECTPPTSILEDPCPYPFTWPRTLTLRTHQRIGLDYFRRMEQRAIRYQPLGSFPRWIPTKYGGQLLWWDAWELTLQNHKCAATVRVRPPPDTVEQIEYTSRMFWLADESGMGKTVLMLCLLLGPTEPLIPLDYVDVYMADNIQRKRRTTASLVIADALMTKGKDSWIDLAKRLYPSTGDRVYVIESQANWNALSHRTIQEARLIVMAMAFYRIHYNRAAEYPDPEDTSTVLHYQWQRIVFDDCDNWTLAKLSAHVYYGMTTNPANLQPMRDPTAQLRKQESDTWDCHLTEANTHLGYYIQKQCTWRRTVRSMANELVRPRLLYRNQVIPLVRAESVLVSHGANSLDFAYDVPVCIKYKHLFGSTLAPYVPADATPVSLLECIRTYTRARKNEICPNLSDLKSEVRRMPGPRQRVGSLLMGLLVLLQQHWREHPEEKVLIVCPSKHSLLAVGQVLKEQQIPLRCVTNVTTLAYRPEEYVILKKIKRKHALAVLVQADKNQRVASNKFKDIHHVFVLSSHASPDTMTESDFVSIRDSLARPVPVDSMSPPIHIVTVHPVSIYNPEPVNLSDPFYAALDQEEFVISLGSDAASVVAGQV